MANPLDSLRVPQAGDPSISAELLRTMIEEIIASREVTGAGSSIGSSGLTLFQKPGAEALITARLTVASTDAAFYEWEEVRPNLTVPEWQKPNNALTHAFKGEALASTFISFAHIGAICTLVPTLQRSGKLVYVANTENHHARLAVLEVEKDYLVCQPAGSSVTDGSDDILVAKPFTIRSNSASEVWTNEPAYVEETSIIWAQFAPSTGVTSGAGDVLMIDLNIDGRRSDQFWAEITAASFSGSNVGTYDWEEVTHGSSGWVTLTDGRSGESAENSIEANNTGTGVEGNGIDVDGDIFDDNSGLAMVSVRGNPVVRMHLTRDANNVDYPGFQVVNSIDGTCG